MLIIDILKQKQQEILNSGNAHEIKFTTEEIKVLGSRAQLRSFKLHYPIPQDYVPCENYFQAYEKIKSGDGIHRVLELSIEYNGILKQSANVCLPSLIKGR